MGIQSKIDEITSYLDTHPDKDIEIIYDKFREALKIIAAQRGDTSD
jgi:hypothetical protein